MFENFIKLYLKQLPCMWKNHTNNPAKKYKKRRKNPYARIRTVTKNRSKQILDHLDWFIPFKAFICTKCDSEINRGVYFHLFGYNYPGIVLKFDPFSEKF